MSPDVEAAVRMGEAINACYRTMCSRVMVRHRRTMARRETVRWVRNLRPSTSPRRVKIVALRQKAKVQKAERRMRARNRRRGKRCLGETFEQAVARLDSVYSGPIYAMNHEPLRVRQ